LFTHPEHLVMREAEFIPHRIKLVPVIFSITGGALARLVYDRYSQQLYDVKVGRGRMMYVFLNRK